MKHELSYEIEHIDLSNTTIDDKYNSFDIGKYLVFWWKNIALGHLYTGRHTGSSNNDFVEMMIGAIQPAITFYAQQSDMEVKDWQSWLRQNALETWRNWMENLFRKYDENNIPEKVQISVIICTRNRPKQLQECLLQLQSLVCRPEEIIIVDNASDDDATKKIVEKFDGVKYVAETKKGLSFARNTGITLAQQPIIAFTDDDVVVHPLWIFRLWNTFNNSTVKAMTGLVLASKLETEAQQIFERYWSFNRGYIEKNYDVNYFKSNLKNGPPVWEIGAGANMAFRKDIFKEIGLFDVLHGAGASGCSEDSELWFRILAKGFTIKYDPKAVVYHEHRQDMNGLKMQIYCYMRGFAAAAMSQQNQVKNAGYNNRLFKWLPYHYMKRAIKGFPSYELKYKTLGVEVKGILSGVAYYLRNKKKFLKFDKQETK